MSIRVMSWVWENGPTDQGELLVMLALADFANDAGKCWPSMQSIARKARLTERGAQKIVRRLQSAGMLSIVTGGGRGGCNTYIVNTGNPEQETPNDVHPEPRSPRTTGHKPRTRVQETPNTGSPEPSGTVKNRQQSRESAATAHLGENREGAALPDTHRENLLAAMGIGPDGIAGPSAFIGTQVDMAEAARWDAMGIDRKAQVQVIAEACRRQRSKDPTWTPRRFAYFTNAMSDLARAKAGISQPMPGADPKAAQIARYKRIAGAAQ
jgi:hypothetical protein